MGSFLTGALSGYTGQASKMRDKGQPGAFRRGGLFRKKRKVAQSSHIGPAPAGLPGSMKHGGKVRKTGKIKLHRGERVIPAKRAKKRGRAKGRY